MSIWSQLLQELENFPRDVRELRVSPCADPEELRAELESHYPFGAPVALGTLTAEVIRLLRAWTVHVTHPRYFGLFVSCRCSLGRQGCPASAPQSGAGRHRAN